MQKKTIKKLMNNAMADAARTDTGACVVVVDGEDVECKVMTEAACKLLSLKLQSRNPSAFAEFQNVGTTCD